METISLCGDNCIHTPSFFNDFFFLSIFSVSILSLWLDSFASVFRTPASDPPCPPTPCRETVCKGGGVCERLNCVAELPCLAHMFKYCNSIKEFADFILISTEHYHKAEFHQTPPKSIKIADFSSLSRTEAHYLPNTKLCFMVMKLCYTRHICTVPVHINFLDVKILKYNYVINMEYCVSREIIPTIDGLRNFNFCLLYRREKITKTFAVLKQLQ